MFRGTHPTSTVCKVRKSGSSTDVSHRIDTDRATQAYGLYIGRQRRIGHNGKITQAAENRVACISGQVIWDRSHDPRQIICKSLKWGG